MKHHVRVTCCALAVLGVLLTPRLAHAYLDPGTTQSIFTFLAPILALFGALLGYILWPFRYTLLRLFRRSKTPEEAPPPPAQEAPPAEEPPKEE